ATPVTNSQLLRIAVRDDSPSRAVALANEVAETLVSQQQQALIRNNAQAQEPVREEIASTLAALNTATVSLAQLQAAHAPNAQIALAQANLDSLRMQLDQYESSLRDIQTNQAKNASFLHVAQAARFATPVRTYTLIYSVAGLALGLVLGLLIVLVLDRFDQRI